MQGPMAQINTNQHLKNKLCAHILKTWLYLGFSDREQGLLGPQEAESIFTSLMLGAQT